MINKSLTFSSQIPFDTQIFSSYSHITKKQCLINVAAIEKLLMDFLERARSSEFQYTSIDRIISEKLVVEAAISKIDRTLLKEKRLSGVEFLDVTYIKKPARPMVRPMDNEGDLFHRFDQVKQVVNL